VKIKFCGFTEKTSLQTAIDQGCDFVGLVFHPSSPRYISPRDSSKLAELIPDKIAKVAVVVDPTLELLAEIVENFRPDYFQLHGLEDIQFIKKIREKFPNIKIIKAFRVASAEDLQQIALFENAVDLFLFDSKNQGQQGGSGQKFDWSILKKISVTKPWFLSGGINVGNFEEALLVTGAQMLDISSGIEEIKGQKSSKLIEEFMNKIARN
jgi:phosphoribosylanthranilate isomerase